MGLNQLDVIRKQIESTVKNRVAGETAKVRRGTSLIGEISRLTGKTNRKMEEAAQRIGRQYAARQPETLEQADWQDDNSSDASPTVCADGYVRRSPVQPLYTPPDYFRRLLRRALGIIVVVLFALAVLWLLVHYSVLSI